MSWKDAGWGIALAVLIGWAYGNSFPGAFHYDDFPLLLDHPAITGPSFEYAWFAESYGGRPLTLWSFHLNHLVSGPDPGAFHAVSVALHLLAAILLFALLARELRNRWIAFVAAAVFAVHPLQSQAVNYIWSRSVLLMAVFSLVALLLGRRHPWAAMAAFQAAVWSRAEALVLLVPLALMNRRLRLPLLVLAGLNLLSLGAGMFRYDPAQVAWNHGSAWAYWLGAPLVFWRYLGMMLWPRGFSVFHGRMPEIGLWFMPALLGLVLLAWLLWRKRKAFPEVALGLAAAGLFLAPSLLMPNSDAFSESRAYLAVAGMGLAVAGLGARLWRPAGPGAGLRRRGLPWAGAGGALILLLALGQLTRERNRVWQDDVAIWEEAVAAAPEEHLPHYNLGVALAREGRIALAENAFLEGARLNPRDDMSYSGLGFCAESRGHWQAAAGLYSRALDLNPRNLYALEAFERVKANLN